MQEEIFGPVVGITKAKDFDEAIEIANNTEYGLTGAVITNNRMNLKKHVKISMLEIFISTVNVQVRLLDTNHLVVSTCLVQIQKPVDQITYILHMQAKTTSEMY